MIHDRPEKGNPPSANTEKAFWMRLADRLYGISPGESLCLVSDQATATITAAGEAFIHVRIDNAECSPSVGEAVDIRSSKTARLLASWGFAFAPGEEERTAWFAAPPNGIDDTPSTIPITRQQRRAAARSAGKRGAR